MARRTVAIYRRPTQKKGQFRYYIKIWDEAQEKYIIDRSSQALASELGLDEKKFPTTSKAGALLIAQEYLRRGGLSSRRSDILLADYCTNFWDWEKSEYIQGKLARGLRIGKEYVNHCLAYIRQYVRPAFPALKLSSVKPYQLESFMMGLKKTTSLSNSSINAIFEAVRIPLREAHRLGIIPSNPGENIRKLSITRTEKGIPTEEELGDILALDLDPRIRCAILLGAVCGLRLGEVQALRPEHISEGVLRVQYSWSKVEGLKSTKTGKTRTIPLPEVVQKAIEDAKQANPHNRDGFIMYGGLPDAPLDCRFIERCFDKCLVMIELGESFQSTPTEEKKKILTTWKDRNISFHSLRHFANAHLRGAVPDETLRKLTGHRTAEMTNHYDHTTETDLENLREAQEKRIIPLIRSA